MRVPILITPISLTLIHKMVSWKQMARFEKKLIECCSQLWHACLSNRPTCSTVVIFALHPYLFYNMVTQLNVKVPAEFGRNSYKILWLQPKYFHVILREGTVDACHCCLLALCSNHSLIIKLPPNVLITGLAYQRINCFAFGAFLFSATIKTKYQHCTQDSSSVWQSAIKSTDHVHLHIILFSPLLPLGLGLFSLSFSLVLCSKMGILDSRFHFILVFLT